MKVHENRHILDQRKQQLQQQVLELSGKAEEALRRALDSMLHNDRALARGVVQDDDRINDAHEKAEQAGFVLIASQQPVAHDLREIIVAMRIAGELERIADHAANVAKIRLEIGRDDLGGLCVSETGMLGDEVISMLHLSMSSYRGLDVEAAGSLNAMEARIDEVIRPLVQRLFDAMKQNADDVEDGSRMLWIIHNLERIADRATNIAEQVIYAVTSHEAHLN